MVVSVIEKVLEVHCFQKSFLHICFFEDSYISFRFELIPPRGRVNHTDLSSPLLSVTSSGEKEGFMWLILKTALSSSILVFFQMLFMESIVFILYLSFYMEPENSLISLHLHGTRRFL